MRSTSHPQGIYGSAGEPIENEEIRITVTPPRILNQIEPKYRDVCYWTAAHAWLEYKRNWTLSVEGLIWDILDPDVTEDGEISAPELDTTACINHMTYILLNNESEFTEHFEQLQSYVTAHYPNHELTDCLALRQNRLAEIGFWLLTKKGNNA